MMTAPRVSVLIPVYNSAPFLTAAIDSVLQQDFVDFELTLVDDGSDDGSRDILTDYARRDPRIKVELNASNKGMVANWNHCLAISRGEYVHFLLGDDLLCDRSALSAMVRQLDQDNSVSLVASARNIIDSASSVTDVLSNFRAGIHDGNAVIRLCLETSRNLIGEPSVVMFRRSAAGAGFDDAYRQLVDLEMWFRLLRQGSLSFISRPLAAFRRHPGQQTVVNVQNLVHIDEMLWLLRSYGDRLPSFSRQYLAMHQHVRYLRQFRHGAVTADAWRTWLGQRVNPVMFRLVRLPLYRAVHPFWKLYTVMKMKTFTR